MSLIGGVHIRGVEIGDEASAQEEMWAPLLSKWGRVLDQYVEVMASVDPGNTPEWLYSHTKSGLVAAAVSRLEPPAFVIEHCWPSIRPRRGAKRPDLLLCVKGQTALVEVEVGIYDAEKDSGVRDHETSIRNNLDKASKALNEARGERERRNTNHGLAVCIASIFTFSSSTESTLDLGAVRARLIRDYGAPKSVIAVWGHPTGAGRGATMTYWAGDPNAPWGLAFIGELVWSAPT